MKGSIPCVIEPFGSSLAQSCPCKHGRDFSPFVNEKNELQQWKEIADSDLNLADFSSKNMWPVPYTIICFHCQQAAEKYLKWFLVFHDIEPPKIHDLEELEKLCETIQPQFSAIYEKCCLLTGYAVQSRYPNEIKVDKQDMDNALSYVKEIREFIRFLFPEYFEEMIVK